LGSYQIITDPEVLEALCVDWRKCPTLAVDTEFIRTDTFWPKVALIQISDGVQTYLVDPLALSESDLLPLKDVLCSSNGPIVIIHACYEDLEVFKRMWGTTPHTIFDTQMCAAILGYGLQVGYQRLVAEVLQKEVSKGETRSNWLQRPLTESQLDYAALDVAYLTEIYQIFSDVMAEKGRTDWLQEDCQRINSQYQVADDPSNYYVKFRNAWRFKPTQLRALYALSSWREETAREHDLPRGFLLKDPVLFKLAEELPESLNQLSGDFEIRKHVLRKDGAKLIEIINSASVDESLNPSSIISPLSKELKPLMVGLKAVARTAAENHDVPAELLLKKRDLERIVRIAIQVSSGSDEIDLCAVLGEWRCSLLKEAILDVLNQHQSLLARFQ